MYVLQPDVVFYLAHPIASDDHYTTRENLDHAIEVQEILRLAGIWTVAPWYSWVDYHGASSGRRLEYFLRFDEYIIEKLDFKVIAAGHKLSNGMIREINFALNNGGDTFNFVGTSDSKLGGVARKAIFGG